MYLFDLNISLKFDLFLLGSKEVSYIAFAEIGLSPLFIYNSPSPFFLCYSFDEKTRLFVL